MAEVTSGFSKISDDKTDQKETSCCCLCRCTLADEPEEHEVESFEQSGREACGCCPRICHCPVDLGPRQCTWRSAEVGLWINMIFTVRMIYYDAMRPSWNQSDISKTQISAEVLLLGWDFGGLIVAMFSLCMVHKRDRKGLIQVFFCLLVIKIVGILYKQAAAAIVVGVCNIRQVEFKGCGLDECSQLNFCLPSDTCETKHFESSGCKCVAPGLDVCNAQQAYYQSGWGIFWQLFDLWTWIGGNLQILLAGLTRYNRKRQQGYRDSKRNLLATSP